ncbi:MAG: GTP-binding protein [Candidatus Lokiarchaeota archaeon]
MVRKVQLFSDLLNQFLEKDEDIVAAIVSDEDGLMIAGEKRKKIDMEIVSFLTAVVNPMIERIRHEFAFKKFGTANFDTEDYRLLFISIDESTTLSIVLDIMAEIDRISPYAYFLAEKVAQILLLEEGDNYILSFPDFDVEGICKPPSNRISNQIYESRVNNNESYRFKFIIIGDHEVGKTSLIRRFVDNAFLHDYRATIGLNIISHEFEAFNNRIGLMIWDIGAQRYFKRYRKTYYNGTQAAFIVFDLTSRESFENITYWHNELRDFIENEDLPIIIIGNKKDLEDQRMVSFEEGKSLAKDLSELSDYYKRSELSNYSDLSNISGSIKSKISYVETSALTGDNVEDAFKLLSYHFILRSKEIEEERLKNEIQKELNSIFDYKENLTLTFMSEDSMWNPGFQIINEIELKEDIREIDNKKNGNHRVYSNGIILELYNFDKYKLKDTDGVFCIFDGREIEHINPNWNEILIDILKSMKKSNIISVGIRVSEETNWSKLMNEFEITEIAEQKDISVLFFKIGNDYREDIINQLKTFLNTMKNLLLAY